MKHSNIQRLLRVATLLGVGLMAVSLPSVSQTTPVVLGDPLSVTYNAAHYTQTPITTVESAPPIVMLNMTRDHQLFYKAYNDYSDLDSDGAPETTYKHSIDYYGYFDTGKCYTYTNNRFEPASITANKYCNAGTTTGQWSGNFLNWVSTTRLDAVRKLLYGGTRSTDSSADTVLERAPLPTDAHSFAKYYNGADIAQLTPFTGLSTTAPTTTSTTSRAVGTGSRQFDISSGSLGSPALGDQITVVRTSEPSKIMRGYVSAATATSVTVEVYSSAGSGTHTDWTLTNLSRTGISFCNLTWAASGVNSHDANTAPPLLRVASGNFELWGANERWQCYWQEEKNSGGTSLTGSGRNGNLALFSGLNASNASPLKAQHALGTGSNAGASNTANGEYYVRIQSCVSGLEGTERCKTYPSGNKKPIGLLQVYGDDDRIRFGLMTSSYQRNVSGGVLRKNVSSFRDETNEDTDGTFVASPASGGIVNTMNALRMWGYKYSDGTYINGDRENCDFQLVGIAATGTTVGNREVAEGSCASWGNPVGEVYMESLRYLGAIAKTNAFDYSATANNKDTSLGLGIRTFADPLNNTNYCANLNVLTFTASVSSYDNDQMGGLSGLRGSPDVDTFTDAIGTAESIHGNSWFIGKTPGNTNQLCTGKTISSLAAVDGICPEASAIEGAFKIAGASLYARNNRIRNDFPASGSVPLVPPANDTTSFKVTSYGIELATNTPAITILQPGTGRRVVIQPVYRLDRSSTGAGPFGSGAIVDFRIVSQDTVNGRGRFYVNWEDSTQGGDYDQDMYGVIDYEFLSGDRIKITTDAVSASTANGQGFGYIVSGTTKDGPHFHSGILNYDYLNESAGNPITVLDPLDRVLNGNSTFYGRQFIDANGGCSNCVVGDPATSVIYDLGSAAAGVLKSPLYYAAKYGGFVDTNGNGLPDLATEWDARDGNGLPGSDGVPDTYFLVSNPTALETSLRAALDAIIAKTASGTAAAVVSNAQEGQGAVYQALYESSRTDANGRNVKWIGSLQSVFIDSKGRLREDGNGDATLQESNYATDPAFEAFFDPTDRTTKLRRFIGDPANGSFTVVPLNNLRTIWNARERLSSLTNVGTQRAYADAATNGRYVFTAIDADQNGTIASSEVQPFVRATFTNSNYGLLNTTNRTLARRIVDFVRGDEISGFRNRTIDYYNNSNPLVARLGDIVQSTPTPVGRPSEGYNLLYGDKSYNAFAQKWAQRRTVVYAGANDGMLHAFNGGFFNPTTKQFQLSANSETAHPLGAELWAYVPFNLLPHLRWLTENNYAHQYYVDGKPKVFDARIFTPDTDHPHGWGTVMVVGMRFGGGQIDVPAATAGLSGVTASFRSAYIVMDITNPEVPPTVIAELTMPEIGYTTGIPSVWVRSARDTTTANAATVAAGEQWLLVFGNGPQNDSPDGARTGASGATATAANLFVYDLKARAFTNSPISLGVTGAFVGDVAAVDWDLDFKTNALYFGTIGGTASAPTGGLYKIDTVGTNLRDESSSAADWRAPALLVNSGSPIVSAPTVTLDEFENRWVYAGTGRFYVNGATDNDKLSSAQQKMFGVIDRLPNASTTVTDSNYDPALPRTFADLMNTTSAAVLRDGRVSGVAALTTTELPDSKISDADRADPRIDQTLSTAQKNTEVRKNNYEDRLVRSAIIKKGWRINLGTTTPAERLTSRTALFGEILFATPFTPSPTLCEGEGSSRLTAVYYKSGAPRAGVPTFGVTLNTGATPDGTTSTVTTQPDGTTVDTTVTTTTTSSTTTNPDGSTSTTSTTTITTTVVTTAPDGTVSTQTSSKTSSSDQVIGSVSLGQGLAAGVALHLDASNSISTSQLTAISQTSTAALTNTRATVGTGVRSGEIDWRDSRLGR